MKQVIALIVMMLCIVTPVSAQAFIDTFDSNASLSNWADYGANDDGGRMTTIADGQIYTTGGNLNISLSGLYNADTQAEKGIFRPVSLGSNNWEISASVILTSQMLTNNDYSWSLNLRAVTPGMAIFVGVDDRIDAPPDKIGTSPVWRTGEMNSGDSTPVWTNYPSAALLVGENTISIRGFETGYEVHINGNYLTSGNFASGSGWDSLNSMGLSGFSYGEFRPGVGFSDYDIQFGMASAQVFSGSPYSGSAVPEPSTYALIAGTIVLGLVVLRKRLGKSSFKER